MCEFEKSRAVLDSKLTPLSAIIDESKFSRVMDAAKHSESELRDEKRIYAKHEGGILLRHCAIASSPMCVEEVVWVG